MFENPEVPADIRKGDILLFYGTGAYCNTLLQTEFNSQIGPLELVVRLIDSPTTVQYPSILCSHKHCLSYQVGQSQDNVINRDEACADAVTYELIGPRTRTLFDSKPGTEVLSPSRF